MMRRSFGGSGGGMGGGSGNGGMLRTVHRAVRAAGGAPHEPFSHSSTTAPSATNTTSPRSPTTFKTTLSLSSPNNTNPFNLPISATSTRAFSSPCSSDEFDQWEFIDDGTITRDHEDELALGVNYDNHIVFGSVPSLDEVQHAVSSLQEVLDSASFSQLIKHRAAHDSDKDVADQITSPTGFIRRVPSVGSEVDWVEPSVQLCNSSLLKSYGSDKVYDAFHLLQTEPTVKRMVLSLSSDKAVWDAVLNNEVVRELRESLDEVDKNVDVGSISDVVGPEDSKPAMDILSWIFINTKERVMGIIYKITKMVDELFMPPESEKKAAADSFEERLRTSFMLSVVVFLVVVVTRASMSPP